MHGILIAAVTVSVLIACAVASSQFTRIAPVRGRNLTIPDAATGRDWPNRCRGCGNPVSNAAPLRHGMVLCDHCTIPKGA